jgi:integrase
MSRRVKQGKDRRNKERPYVVRWSDGPDPTGKVKWFSQAFKYKLESDRFAAEKRTEEPEIAEFTEEPMQLGRLIVEWSKTRRSEDYRIGTRRLDEDATRRLTDYFGKKTPLSEITPMKAEQFIASLSRIDGRDGTLSAWSRARILRNVRTIFNRAVEWGLTGKNPFAGVKRPRPPESNWYYLPPDEFYAILNASKGKRAVSLRCKVLYALAYCCGLRLGEILSLTWADNIKIVQAVQDGVVSFTGEVHIVNRPGTENSPPFHIKDRESREIRIPQRCLEFLLDLRAYNEMTDQSPYVVLDQGQYLTLAAKWQERRRQRQEWQNKDMANNTLTTFKRHVGWAGINPEGSLSLHTLRKCCITNWANNISNPEVVRKLAGHADIKTTMQYYSKVTEEQRRKAAEVTDRLLEMGLSSPRATGTYEG